MSGFEAQFFVKCSKIDISGTAAHAKLMLVTLSDGLPRRGQGNSSSLLPLLVAPYTSGVTIAVRSIPFIDVLLCKNRPSFTAPRSTLWPDVDIYTVRFCIQHQQQYFYSHSICW